MIFAIRYFNRYTDKVVDKEFSPASDAVTIRLPAQESEHLPALRVEINSDGVAVFDSITGAQLWLEGFSEMVADARADHQNISCPPPTED